MVDAPDHVQQPVKGVTSKHIKIRNITIHCWVKRSLKQIHCSKGMYAHQTNQPIRIENKVMFCCLRITYEGMHTPYLHNIGGSIKIHNVLKQNPSPKKGERKTKISYCLQIYLLVSIKHYQWFNYAGGREGSLPEKLTELHTSSGIFYRDHVGQVLCGYVAQLNQRLHDYLPLEE